MSGTRRYRKLSAETLGTLLRLISEDELTPKQIAERAGVSRQQVYEYRKIKPDFRYCPGCAGVATPYRDDAISPDVRETGDGRLARQGRNTRHRRTKGEMYGLTQVTTD